MSFLRITLILLALFAAGCASQPSSPENASSADSQVQEVEPWDGDGMEIPLDGSSKKAWDTSMARVKAHSTEAQYITLENAIEYLMLYDLQAGHDFDKLIARLDGLTGYEVIARINWRKPAPGKGPAEKGAADAKIIDT